MILEKNDRCVRPELYQRFGKADLQHHSEVKADVAINDNHPTLLFQSPQMVSLVAEAKRFARSSAAVLITGESGTGKELFSRLIHNESQRSDQPFVAVNCAAIAESLFESEMFGHERGAFTGATTRKEGWFERASHGTLLLDEISEIPTSLQSKLLRVLEEREYVSVGGTKPQPVDVRIVATSNRQLADEVEKDNFRQDLFHRLSVLTIELPSLRDRVADIPLLTRKFIEIFSGESLAGVSQISSGAMKCLCDYQWPGNIRELRNVIQRACVVCQTDEISLDDLPGSLLNRKETQCETSELPSLPGLTIAAMEKHLILNSLQRNNGNKTEAAAELGVTARTLRNKLKQYLAEGLELTP